MYLPILLLLLLCFITGNWWTVLNYMFLFFVKIKCCFYLVISTAGCYRQACFDHAELRFYSTTDEDSCHLYVVVSLLIFVCLCPYNVPLPLIIHLTFYLLFIQITFCCIAFKAHCNSTLKSGTLCLLLYIFGIYITVYSLLLQ